MVVGGFWVLWLFLLFFDYLVVLDFSEVFAFLFVVFCFGVVVWCDFVCVCVSVDCFVACEGFHCVPNFRHIII